MNNLTEVEMMGMGGPMISGAWINQKTGEKVVVRDSYMDGDKMYVILTNGQQLSLEDFQDYVQMSEESYDERGRNIGIVNDEADINNKNEIKDIKYDPAIIFDGIDTNVTKKDGESDLQRQILSNEFNDNVDTSTPSNTENKSTASEQEEMIMKIFNKVEKPTLSFIVNWNNYPKKELAMLKEYFNVTNDDIAKAIMKKFINEKDINNIICKWVDENLD